MLAETGLFLLIVAMAVALLQSAYLLPVMGKILAPLMPVGAWLQSLTITLAVAILITLRIDNDFSVANVVAHSNLHLPLLYKIVGAWGNHEGSMLLWVWVLAAYGLASAMRYPAGKETALSIQSILCAGFIAFIIFTSNPFERQFPPAADGQALNPLLQDIALAMHPPMLYLGYVGFSMVFSFAVAALLQCEANREWAQSIHPWIMFAWGSLTLGIGLGSWWAYRELGWGGWWFWDPVENASLLPWLSGTALLHANSVLKKRGMLAQWVVLLAIITFGLSLLGTFLVRSGALTSVHGFASDPARGLFILGYMAVLLGGALLLFGLRGNDIASKEKALPLSREGMIVINNLFIMSACAVVLLGTIYPLLIEWINGSKLTVGPRYFNATFLPLIVIPLFFAALAPFMAWKKVDIKESFSLLIPALLAVLAAATLVLAFIKTELVLALLGFSLSAWLAAASVSWAVKSSGVQGRWALLLGHAGAAIMIFGITGASLWKEEIEKSMAVGDAFNMAGYRMIYENKQELQKDNYKTTTGTFAVTQGKRLIATLTPEYRTYSIRNMATSEASIYSTLWSDVYAVVGEASADGKRTAVRFYYMPLINFIWIGFVSIACAGFLSITGRRKRDA